MTAYGTLSWTSVFPQDTEEDARCPVGKSVTAMISPKKLLLICTWWTILWDIKAQKAFPPTDWSTQVQGCWLWEHPVHRVIIPTVFSPTLQ